MFSRILNCARDVSNSYIESNDRHGCHVKNIENVSRKVLELSASRAVSHGVNITPFSAMRLFWWASLLIGTYTQKGHAFPAQIELSSLSGTEGFTIVGEQAGDQFGFFVSNAGDIYEDGMDDLLIGAPYAAPLGQQNSGKSYVIFGRTGLGSKGKFELSSLNGKNGFVLFGEAVGDRSGISVSSAGDVNGDGIGDLIVGARYASLINRTGTGITYVIFGGKNIARTGVLELSALNGSNGFRLFGEGINVFSGYSVSGAGDVNGDGKADLLIGAHFATPSGKMEAGKAYVIFGRKVNDTQCSTTSQNDLTSRMSTMDSTTDPDANQHIPDSTHQEVVPRTDMMSMAKTNGMNTAAESYNIDSISVIIGVAPTLFLASVSGGAVVFYLLRKRNQEKVGTVDQDQLQMKDVNANSSNSVEEKQPIPIKTNYGSMPKSGEGHDAYGKINAFDQTPSGNSMKSFNSDENNSGYEKFECVANT